MPDAQSAPTVAKQLPDFAESFTEIRLQELLEEDRAIFVNLTADWCITCKANESVAFTKTVENLKREREIAYLIGDWTRRDPEIADKLAEFGRAGVPLYIVYPKPSSAGLPFFFHNCLQRTSCSMRLVICEGAPLAPYFMTD